MYNFPITEIYAHQFVPLPCVLQGQTDLLRGAKLEAVDAVRQLTLACEASGLAASSPN